MASTAYHDPLTLTALAQIRAESLSPAEQPTTRATLRSADCYQQRFLKFPHRATFHSYAEYLHALLLEADKEVRSFVPHPYKLWFKGRQYIPDCFVLKNSGPVVIELRPNGIMENPPPDLIRRFFEHEGIAFEILNNEHILAREQEALNWRPLIQAIVVAQEYGVDTRNEELELLDKCKQLNTFSVVNLLIPGLHDSNSNFEIALYRLLYQHHLKANLQIKPLNYYSELSLCE